MNSWEPEENLVNAKDILLDFQRAKKLLPLSPVSLPEKTDKCALAKPERGKRKASYGKNRIDSESEGEPLDIQGVSSDALSSSAESDGLESSVSDDDIQIDLKRSRIFLSEQESKFLSTQVSLSSTFLYFVFALRGNDGIPKNARFHSGSHAQSGQFGQPRATTAELCLYIVVYIWKRGPEA